MKPIISPLWFYLIDIGDSISLMLVIVGFTVALIMAVLLLSGIDYYTDEEYKKMLSKSKKWFLIPIFMIIIGMLIPSSETGYQMLVASLITPDNVDAAGGFIEDIINNIIETSQQLGGGK